MEKKTITIEFEYFAEEEDTQSYPYTGDDNIACALGDPDICVNAIVALGYDPAAVGTIHGSIESE